MSETKALTIKNETLDAVSKRIKAMQAGGEIHFPPDYSPQNALNSAWLELQELEDKNHQKALAVCAKASICNALLDMVIQGLNPAKDQDTLLFTESSYLFQRSYFGTMAVAKRVDTDIEDTPAEVVYKGDALTYEIVKGQKFVTEHKQKIENINPSNIIAAYAMVIDNTGEVRKCVIMTMDEIKQAWKQSKMKPILDNGDIKPGSTHANFTAEMCKRTVINRICKPIINSSNDANLKLAAGRSEVVQAEGEAQENIEEHANQEFIDIDPEPVELSEPEEKQDEPEKPVYLVCPSEINSKQPRKAIEVCHKCKNKEQCNSYIEYSMDNDPNNGPDF